MNNENLTKKIKQKRWCRLVIQFKDKAKFSTFYAHPINRAGVSKENALRLQYHKFLQKLSTDYAEKFTKAIIFNNETGAKMYEFPKKQNLAR